MEPSIAVVLLCASPSTWTACERVLGALAEVAPLPVTLLAVPRLHGAPRSASFDAALTRRLEAGDELALHGYDHGCADGVGAAQPARRAGAEFHSLRCDDALQRLHQGVGWFAANGWPLTGFVAPHGLLGPGGWAALQLLPFHYTLADDELHALRRGESLHTPQLQPHAGSAWRRAAHAGSALLPRSLQRRLSPQVRIELQPHDADTPPLRRRWQQCLRDQLRWRRACTLQRLLADWPHEGTSATALLERQGA